VGIADADAALGLRRGDVHHGLSPLSPTAGRRGRRLSLDCYQKMMAQFADSSSPQDVADLIHA
jgi:hypothetical protein